MKKLCLGDLILATICGALIVAAVININNSNTSVPSPKIERITE